MKQAMMVAVATVAGLLCLVGWADNRAAAPGPAERVVFARSGYSIAVLDEPGQETYQSLFMFLPPSDDFAPSVNVQVQKFDGTLAEYIKLSKDQLDQMGMKLLAEPEVGKSSAVFEYAGAHEADGPQVRHYGKVVLANGKAYLATGTALQGQWKAVAEKLKGCVDSLTAMPAALPTTRPGQ